MHPFVAFVPVCCDHMVCHLFLPLLRISVAALSFLIRAWKTDTSMSHRTAHSTRHTAPRIRGQNPIVPVFIKESHRISWPPVSYDRVGATTIAAIERRSMCKASLLFMYIPSAQAHHKLSFTFTWHIRTCGAANRQRRRVLPVAVVAPKIVRIALPCHLLHPSRKDRGGWPYPYEGTRYVGVTYIRLPVAL